MSFLAWQAVSTREIFRLNPFVYHGAGANARSIKLLFSKASDIFSGRSFDNENHDDTPNDEIHTEIR